MPTIFEKMNLKAQKEIIVLNAPPSFEAELDGFSELFARKAKGDALLWFAYTKGSSKRYQCEFNRDTGWELIRVASFDSVRMVAIDEDWSALCFRRTEYIKS